MDAIGGYFDLELRKGEHYHKNAIKLNTARNCFEYILLSRQYTKVYIPYYTCEVLLEPLRKHNIEYEFYSIDEKFEPTKMISLSPHDAFLYTNYYGLKQNCVKRMASLYHSQLIVDNAQAFFAPPLKGVDTFYSARKFFGVSDGAYLYLNSDTEINLQLEQDYSYDRMLHLLKRIDLGAESGYVDFQKNDEVLINNPILKMSKLTEKILRSLDYEYIIQRRKDNYLYLYSQLKGENLIQLDIVEGFVPMVYPLYAIDDNIREKLIENKIYIATYWPNVFDWCKKNSTEYRLAKKILPLPIDQRYGMQDMINIIKNILQ